MPSRNDILGELNQDEIDLILRFRDQDPIGQARIILATHAPDPEPDEREMLKLETIAAYLACNEYGRERCLEAFEIFASSSSVEQGQARLEEVNRTRASATVISISDFRQ